MEYETGTAAIVPAALRGAYEELPIAAQERASQLVAVTEGRNTLEAIGRVIPIIDSLSLENEHRELHLARIVTQLFDEVHAENSDFGIDDTDSELVHSASEKLIELFDQFPEEYESLLDSIDINLIATAFRATTPHEDELLGSSVYEDIKSIIGSDEPLRDVAYYIVKMAQGDGSSIQQGLDDDAYEDIRKTAAMAEQIDLGDDDEDDNSDVSSDALQF